MCSIVHTYFGFSGLTNRSTICELVDLFVATVVHFVPNSYQELQLVVRGAFEWMVENSDLLPPFGQAALDNVIGWGAKCQDDINRFNRGGFCEFQARHLLAAHSHLTRAVLGAAELPSGKGIASFHGTYSEGRSHPQRHRV